MAHQTETSILEAVLIDYMKLTRGETNELLLALSGVWDVPEAMLNEWKMELQNRYALIWGEEEVKSCIDTEVTHFSKQATSMGYFLAMVERCKLAALCQAELETRDNRLANVMKTQSPEALSAFLKETDDVNGQSHFINAIHLGLLGDVGERLGREAFAQLICPDEATAEFYAGVLADYADDARLEGWLSALDNKNQDSLKTMIAKNASETLTFSPVQKFIMFLRNLDKPTPAIRSLCKAVFALKERTNPAPLEAILQPWLLEHGTNKHTAVIREKLNALGFNLPESSRDEERTSSPSSASDESRTFSRSESPTISFETLPDDPTGQILERVERDEHQHKDIQNTTQRYRAHLLSARTSDEPDSSNGLTL